MTKVQFEQFDVSEFFQGVWETLKLPQSTPVWGSPVCRNKCLISPKILYNIYTYINT
jgi:hypothetical protein